jgi:hypothetical protein
LVGLLVVSAQCVVAGEGEAVICWDGCCVGRFAVGTEGIWMLVVIIIFVLRAVGVLGDGEMYIMNNAVCSNVF